MIFAAGYNVRVTLWTWDGLAVYRNQVVFKALLRFQRREAKFRPESVLLWCLSRARWNKLWIHLHGGASEGAAACALDCPEKALVSMEDTEKRKEPPPNPAPKPKGGWRAIYTELVFTVAYLYNYLASRKWLLGWPFPSQAIPHRSWADIPTLAWQTLNSAPLVGSPASSPQGPASENQAREIYVKNLWK